MRDYLHLLRKIMLYGEDVEDRTGVGTRRLFGQQLRFSLKHYFPIITTKKIHLKSIIHELLWFLSGSSNIKYLKDNGVSIWDEWADKEGELGPVYGVQWRKWKTFKEDLDIHNYNIDYVDQVSNLIKNLKENPTSRRHILTAWNVVELDEMALPPCHMMSQYHVTNDGGLITHLYQRSADMFLGVPFNITSYAILNNLIALYTDLKPEELIITFGDCHIYSNHFEQVREQLSRSPKKKTAKLTIKKRDSIFDNVYEDFIIEGYESWPSIKAPIAV